MEAQEGNTGGGESLGAGEGLEARVALLEGDRGQWREELEALALLPLGPLTLPLSVPPSTFLFCF